jgi:rubrerythrin
MDEHLVTQLQAAVGSESQAMIRCLVAAEVAVEDGRFNIAKVMRAAAHAARIRAMHLQRLLAVQTSATAAVEAEQVRQHAQHNVLEEILAHARRHGTEDLIKHLQRLYDTAPSLRDISDRAVDSLQHHRDVMESDVAQFLWGCHGCGYIAESHQPDLCPQCGALGGEFEMFGPFYTATDERLGRRRAEEIVAILQESPMALQQALDGVSEDTLRRYPTPDEWCMKEIAGHMVDVTELFLERLRIMLTSETPPSIRPPTPPWRMLEGKGYPDTPVQEIVERFQAVTEQALSRIRVLQSQDWLRLGLQRGKPCNLLDVGTWLANHNKAHLKQIVALREQFRA